MSSSNLSYSEKACLKTPQDQAEPLQKLPFLQQQALGTLPEQD